MGLRFARRLLVSARSWLAVAHPLMALVTVYIMLII